MAGGLPHLGLPHASGKELQLLIGIAASCFVMIVAQSAATARFYAERHQQSLDENADLVGLSAANAAAALSGTFVVNGSPTQTAMVERSGGRSQLAQISTAVVVALVLLFLTKPLQYLPRCVLGAIVFIIAIKLIDLRKLASIRRESPGEFWLAVTTAVVVVGVGVEQGIILAMVLSLLRIVRHSYHPHTGVLVADADSTWRMSPPVAGAMTLPGLAIYRFGAPLFYANAGRFAEEIRPSSGPRPRRCAGWWWMPRPSPISITPRRACCASFIRDWPRQDVTLAFARVSPYLQADFDRHHITEVIGAEMIFPPLA